MYTVAYPRPPFQNATSMTKVTQMTQPNPWRLRRRRGLNFKKGFHGEHSAGEGTYPAFSISNSNNINIFSLTPHTPHTSSAHCSQFLVGITAPRGEIARLTHACVPSGDETEVPPPSPKSHQPRNRVFLATLDGTLGVGNLSTTGAMGWTHALNRPYKGSLPPRPTPAGG